jgi:hypothetical protein
MQRTASLLLPTLVAALFLTGCPEKKEPAATTAVNKAADKGDEKDKAAEEDRGEDPEAQAEDPKAEHKAPKKKKAADDKDQGGW